MPASVRGIAVFTAMFFVLGTFGLVATCAEGLTYGLDYLEDDMVTSAAMSVYFGACLWATVRAAGWGWPLICVPQILLALVALVVAVLWIDLSMALGGAFFAWMVWLLFRQSALEWFEGDPCDRQGAAPEHS